MKPGSAWWVEHGWATHGSKLQTQLYVNRRRQALSREVLAALPDLAARSPTLEWVVPLEQPRPPLRKPFGEARDGAMLTALGLERLATGLAAFWPARGPVWDALAIVHFRDGSRGAVLAEGKNYPGELYSGGTGAGKSGSRAAAASRRQIERAIAWTQGQLGASLDVGRWCDPLDAARSTSSLYQTANRLAFTVWLRHQEVEAWLCHLLFLEDPYHHPTSRAAWHEGLARAERELGISGLNIPFAGNALLESLDPEVELSDTR